VRKMPGAILIGMLTATALGLATGLTRWTPTTVGASSLSATAFHLDIPAAFRRGGLEIIFVFLFVDLFDNLGTLLAVTKEAGLDGKQGQIPRLNRIFITDSLATMFGSLMGTSTVTGYVESAAGVAAGGRSGVMAIVTGLLFLAAMPLSAVAGLIPTAATTPALVLVGALMVAHVIEIRWKDPVSAIPAFLTIISIPLTFSIATGISFGFVSSAMLRIVRGPRREDWLLYLLAILCVLRFTYLAAG
jgi:adenine/guanine/hypoxanthine permease